jgi:hypothetical protein
VHEFLTVCNANNARTEAHWLSIFPVTLQDHAKQWFQRQTPGQFADWESLKNAFLAHFRPIAYEDRLSELLQDITMTMGESIDSYYGRLEDLVLRLPAGHRYNDQMQMRFFIRGLVPHRLKTYVKEITPATLNQAYRRAKL